MTLNPRRRSSKEAAPSFSEHREKLLKAAPSFLRRFGDEEPKMMQIIEEIAAISSSVAKTHRNTDGVGKVCGLAAGIGLGLSLAAIPFTGGSEAAEEVDSLAEARVEAFASARTAALSLPAAAGGAGGGAVIAAVGGLVAAVVGGAAVMVAHLTKVRKERRRAGEVNELGREFMGIVEPMKEILEEIRSSCEALEEDFPADRAGNALTDVEELQKILRRLVDLKEKSSGRMSESDEGGRLRDAIFHSADQSQKLVDQFSQMKEELRKLTGD